MKLRWMRTRDNFVNFLKVLMLEADDEKNLRSSGRTPVLIDRPVHREFRVVRRFAGNRQLQILNKPAFHPMTAVRPLIVHSSQNEGSD